MAGSKNKQDLTPAVYRIRVQGILDKSWSGQLGGLAITMEQGAGAQDMSAGQGVPGGLPVTVLCGCLPDQAALSGVLNSLCDLGLMLLSVECLGEE